MSKLETNTIDTISGSTTLTLGGTNATTIAQDSATTITGFKSTGIDDNATSTAISIDSSEVVRLPVGILRLQNATTGTADTDGLLIEASGNDVYINNKENASMYFRTNNTDRMRIDSSGLVGINTNSPTRQFNVYSTGIPVAKFERNQGDNNLRTHIEFIREGNTAGEIQCTNTSTTYATSSDYRLKENVSYDFDATTRLKQLKPARFNFIANANKTVDGFIAHEVQSVVPEAITGEKDATETKEKVVVNANGQVIAENIEQADWETGKIADENGNTQYPNDSTWEATKVVPVYQGIDQSKLVPLLVKTIQELEARITALENA